MASDPLVSQIASLLARDGKDVFDFELVPCSAGGNNRVFMAVAGERRLIAKWYFSHPSDTRDRLGAEYGFLSYAARRGISCVPTVIACDPARHLALYEC